jgi:tetratricopeptide (TPR) repeat protein
VTSTVRQSCKFISIGLVFLPFLIAGCAPFSSESQEKQISDLPTEYRSSLADPRAKALFAFSQYRLLGSEGRWDDAISALERAIAFDSQSNYLKVILAKTYLHTEKIEKSAQLLEDLLAQSPDDEAGHELLGDVLSFQGDYVKAIAHFRRALELSPNKMSVQMRLGLALERSGDNASAVDLLESILDGYPQSAVARLALARIYLDEGQVEEAKRAYREILEQVPGHQQATLEYGKILFQDNQAAAVDLYLETLKHNPFAAAVHQRVAQIYLSRQELGPALLHFQAVLKQYPGNLQVLGQTALINLEMKNWAEAEAGFRRLLSAPEHKDRNRYYLSVALSGQSRFDDAIVELEKISPESSNYESSALQLAYLYNQVGRTNNAIQTLQQMLELGLQLPELYYYLAAFLADIQQYDEALEIIHQGTAEYPENVRLLYQLGVVYEKLENSPAAVEVMEQILELDTEHADALNFLAYYQAEKGLDLDVALVRALKAYELMPSGYVADTLGWVYFKLGQYEKSRQYLEAAAGSYPKDSVIQEHLGDLYGAMKLWENAEQSYRRVLTLDPDASHVKVKIDKMEIEINK